jgi:polyhydroxyalkanoate synthesis regulator phasin
VVRKKIFISPKTIRFGIGIIIGGFMLVGSLAVFYVSQQTIPYRQNLNRNKLLVENKGVIHDVNEYFEEVSRPKVLRKRKFLKTAYRLAKSYDLISRVELTQDDISKYIDDLERQPQTELAEDSVIAEDKMSESMRQVIEKILNKNDELSYLHESEFALKKRSLTQLALISNALDGQGTFRSVLARSEASESILRQVYAFQTKTAASAELKNQLIQATVPVITKPFDLQFAFRFEHYRFQAMIDVAAGKLPYDPKSEIIELPKPFNTWQKMKFGVPGVPDAWESRFHEEFAKAIIQCQDTTETASVRDNATLGLLKIDLSKRPANMDYLILFGYEKFVQTPSFGEKDVLLYRIANPETFVSTK